MAHDTERALEDLMADALGLSGARERAASETTNNRMLYRFGRRLLEITDSHTLYKRIVTDMSRVVHAATGALALSLPGEEGLAIVATFGYPEEIVLHVRIQPGEGVLGGVFASGRPTLGRVSAGEGTKSRRYRGDTYIAVPLTGPDGVIGVVSVTDRAAGEFEQRDVALLRAYAVPATLALLTDGMRERLSGFVHLASVDALTGVFNRRHFNDRLEQELERQRREGRELALLLLDIDDFKQLNDLRGHLHGDRVLREVVDIVRRSVRIFDICARFGGEEFAVLMPGANARTAFQIAERIRRNSEIHFGRHLAGGRGGRAWPTLSVGVTTARPGTSGDDLIKEADAALLDAKVSGKNMVRLYSELTEQRPAPKGRP